MVITLDNGQTVTIYEDSNLIREIKPYIDKEIYEVLENAFGSVEVDLEKLEKLEEESVDKEVEYGCLSDKYNDLEYKYDDLYEEHKELEQTKDKILDKINGLSYDLSEDNIEEIKSKLQDLYYKY
jgi:uncharacterized protein YhaN